MFNTKQKCTFLRPLPGHSVHSTASPVATVTGIMALNESNLTTRQQDKSPHGINRLWLVLA